MLNTQEGKDYRYYKIYVWGGLVLIFAYIIIVTLLNLTKNFRTLMIILNIPITVWFLGILAYWWWVFLYKGRGKSERLSPGRGRLRMLKSWSILFDNMMEKGEDREAIEEYERSSRRPLIVWFGLQNFLCFWVFGNFWIWTLYQDHLPANYIQAVWAPGVLVISIILLLSPIFLFKFFGSDPYEYLKPIGLSVREAPSDAVSHSGLGEHSDGLFPEGTLLIGGSRLGRNVFIETKGKYSALWVEGKSPAFTIRSETGKLETDNKSPKEIRDFVKRMPKAKRWRGIVVFGSKEGIHTERNSRGQNMWLYDLWLTEQLYSALSPV